MEYLQGGLADALVQQTLADVETKGSLARLAIDDKGLVRGGVMSILSIYADLLDKGPDAAARQAIALSPPAQLEFNIDRLSRRKRRTRGRDN
jgi:hypothetical protein